MKPPVLILAGGFGSRLKSVTFDTPKPLVKCQKRPFLFYLLEKFIAEGFDEFIFLLHYKPEKFKIFFKDYIKNTKHESIRIDYLIEEEPLGTGGSIINAIDKMSIDKPFIVSNSDTWIQSEISSIASKEPNNIGLVKQENGDRFGNVIAKNEMVVSFNEKTKLEQSRLINSGIYYFLPETFKEFKLSKISLEKEILPYLAKRKQLKSTLLEGNIIDIGIPEDYYKFCDSLIDGNIHTKL